MPKYVMLSTLGPDGSARLRENPERLREVSAEVEAMGVTVLEQFAVLGQWDFINILEAPDEVTMAKVATTLASRGTLKTMTLPIIDIDDFIERPQGSPRRPRSHPPGGALAAAAHPLVGQLREDARRPSPGAGGSRWSVTSSTTKPSCQVSSRPDCTSTWVPGAA